MHDYDFSAAELPPKYKVGCYTQSGNSKECPIYGEQVFKKNDIIEVKYHQKDKKLEFVLNEVSQGIAYDNIPNDHYKLIVYMKLTKSKITLLK